MRLFPVTSVQLRSPDSVSRALNLVAEHVAGFRSLIRPYPTQSPRCVSGWAGGEGSGAARRFPSSLRVSAAPVRCFPCSAPRAPVHELGPPRAGVREPSVSKDAASLVKAFPGLYAYSVETNSRADPLSSFFSHTSLPSPPSPGRTALAGLCLWDFTRLKTAGGNFCLRLHHPPFLPSLSA